MVSIARRQLLSVLAGSSLAAIGGCTNPQSDDTPDTEPTTDPDGCDSPSIITEGIDPDEGFPFARVVSDPVETDTFAIDAEVTRAFREDRPALVVVQYRNKRPETYTFEGGLTPPYSVYKGRHEAIDDTGLVAIPEVDRDLEAALPNDPDEGCWQLREPIEIEPVETVTKLDECDTITRTYRLYADASTDTETEQCLVPGRYVFEERVYSEDQQWALEIELTAESE